MVRLNIEYIPSINYSLVNNRIDVCQFVEITNIYTEDLRNLVITCSGDFFKNTHANIEIIKTSQSIRLQKFDIVPIQNRVASITEKITTFFNLKVTCNSQSNNSQIILSQNYDIDIIPYNQWLGTSILPQHIASFVLPNHPSTNYIVAKAVTILKEISQHSTFTEYQSENTNEIRKQVAAVYGALHNENIVFNSTSAPYEIVGHPISLPNKVLSTKFGNSLDLTLLFAGVLESVGINSGIIIQKNHVLLAVWLVEDCCQYSVCDDSSYIEKKCTEGINEMLVVECSQITSRQTCFEEALLIAEKLLANTADFNIYVDIRRCRLEHIFPLPLHTNGNDFCEISTEEAGLNPCILNVKERSRYDLSRIKDSNFEFTKLDLWERKLLDFSLRNSMLNLYLRQKAIQFISFDINSIEKHLQKGHEFTIVSRPNVSLRITDEERLVRSKLHFNLYDLITNDIKQLTLHSFQTESETQNTLKNIYRASRSAIEETGANALFLAIGILRWYENDLSEKPRYAPILMLPVEIVYKKGNYHIRSRNEEVTLNITLIEFLRQNFNINIPGLKPLPLNEDGVDSSKIFAIIRDVLKNQKRWDIEEEAILGVFSFSKFLMWNDIHNHRKELLNNNIVRSLAEQKLVFSPSQLTSNLKRIDKELTPEKLSLPVPVDSSQMAAVIEASQGNSFILYGPPGTGKSQTITNLIANALFQGKRVLFVAEKMAALSVVQERLRRINLSPFCLEIHSNKTTKRHVLNQLKTAIDTTCIVKPEEYTRIAKDLFAQRSKLIDYIESLHDIKGSEGLSLYDCIVRYESIEATELDIDSYNEELNKNFRIELIETYKYLLKDKYQAILNLIGQPSNHPLLGLFVREEDIIDTHLLCSNFKETIGIIETCITNHTNLSKAEILKKEILRDCKNNIFSENALNLYNEWRTVKSKWFLPRLFAKRTYINKLKRFNPLIIEAEIDSFLSKLIEYQEIHKEIEIIQNAINYYFDFKYENDTFPNESNANKLIEILSNSLKSIESIRDWYQWCVYKKELKDLGLEVVSRKIEQASVPAETLCDSFLKTMFKHFAKVKTSQSSILRTFEGSIFDETVSRYQKLTEDFRILSQKELYARLASKIPHVTDNIDNSSEIGILNRNISNGGRGLSLRDLMDKIPTLLPKLCPCMLMSPMSVAQYLDLSQEKFDIVIFDEASQIPTSEAIGAIARGKSIIVVGDPKQMPPTSFFLSTNVNEDETYIDDMESILEDCRTLDIPSLQLNWHYRSKHESLIAFSNNEYYDGSLITFPSADDQVTKIKYHFIKGIYDKGGRRSNREEAEAIVNEIAKYLEKPDHANNSIGVIAFNVAQQNLIEDLLLELFEKNIELREAAEEMYEPIFIKNLENVQGDERDIIMFSIGYGPNKEGKISMNFGPLNNIGGERRLNVAVSRARQEMLVFSSLKSSQIDLKRSKAKGVEGLKHFLEYAEQQILVQSIRSNEELADSIISEQIANALKKRGYITTTNVGRSDFKINVAISDDTNKNYSLGILLDGQGYHNTQTVRDREVVQPAVLNMLNWKIMKVWSVDWLNNPERVISRIENYIKSDIAPKIEKNISFDVTKENIVEFKNKAKEYVEYEYYNKDIYSMSDKRLVFEILSREQPMTLMYLCRKISLLRFVKLTPPLISSITNITKTYMYTQRLGSCTIVWTNKNAASSFDGYRKNNGRDITEIPLVEIMNAITGSIREQFSIKVDAISLIVTRQLGFSRRGPKIELVIKEALEVLKARNKIVEKNGRLHLSE